MAWISRYGLPSILNVRAFFIFMNEIQKTNTSVQVFNNSSFGDVRTSWIEEKPFFCLVDVCRALELENPSKIANGLDKKGVTISYTLTPKGMQNLLFVNEPNLYRCVFRSRKENAVVFQNWIFEEVIPEIRKTGGYGKQMSKSEMRLMVFMDMQSEIDRQSSVIKKQTKRIAALVSQLEVEKEKKEQKRIAFVQTLTDDVKDWILTIGVIGVIKLSTLHQKYHDWCTDNGRNYMTIRQLAAQLRILGYASIHKRNGTWFII